MNHVAAFGLIDHPSRNWRVLVNRDLSFVYFLFFVVVVAVVRGGEGERKSMEFLLPGSIESFSYHS